jgi:hypothetical protein
MIRSRTSFALAARWANLHRNRALAADWPLIHLIMKGFLSLVIPALCPATSQAHSDNPPTKTVKATN